MSDDKAKAVDTVCITGVRPGACDWALGAIGKLVSIDPGDEDLPYEVEVPYHGAATTVWCYRIKAARSGANLLRALDSSWSALEASPPDGREAARARLIDSQQAVCDYLGIRGPKW